MSGQDSELVGLGVKSTNPIKASPERVWAAMVDKVYNTGKYLPVKDVKTTDKVPGKHIYREMSLNGHQMNENIYLDREHYIIRFAVVDKDEIHVNAYDPQTGLLEYWQENGKGERIPWNAPKKLVFGAFDKTKEIAENESALVE